MGDGTRLSSGGKILGTALEAVDRSKNGGQCIFRVPVSSVSGIIMLVWIKIILWFGKKVRLVQKVPGEDLYCRNLKISLML